MRKLGAIAGVGLALVGLAAPSAAVPPGRLSTPRPVGTVDTVAGPGFCPGPARPDRASSRVGALAADASGTLWFESGPPSEGQVTKVVGSASATVVSTKLTSSERRASEAAGAAPSVPARPSMMAPDQSGDLLVAVPKAVLQFKEAGTAIAGRIPRANAEGPEERAVDGPLLDARFNHILAIASDSAGNVYVADSLNEDSGEITVRFLNRSDRPVTFYGGTRHERIVAPSTADTIAGGVGSSTGPIAAEVPVMAAAPDRLYLGSDGGRAGVRMLNLGAGELSIHGVTAPPAAIVALATGGASRVSRLSGIAADDEGNVLLAEPSNHRVRRLDKTGKFTMLAGTGKAGFNGNDRPATSARLNRPYDVEVGPGGRLYISDAGNSQVRVVNPAGTIRAALGNGTTNRWLCTEGKRRTPAAPATGSRPREVTGPIGVASDEMGNVYVGHAKLRQVHRLGSSGLMRPVVGRPPTACNSPTGCSVGDEVAPSKADLGTLGALAPGPERGLYVLQERRIRFLNLASRPLTLHGVSIPAGGVRTVAGRTPRADEPNRILDPAVPPSIPPIPTGPPASTPDRQAAVAEAPGVTYLAVAADGKGNLLLADVPEGPFFIGYGSVRLVDARGVVTTLVDRPAFRPEADVDPDRCCGYPSGLAADDVGNVYIADSIGGRIWFLNRSQAPIVVHGVEVDPGGLKVVAGAGGDIGSQDEGIAAANARLSRPRGLVLDGTGNLYFADYLEHTVHRVDRAGMITTVVGTGQPGFNGDGLKGQLSTLDHPIDLAIDACGNLLVTDSGNDRVRRVNLVPSCSSAATPAAAGEPGSMRWFGPAVVIALVLVVAALLSRPARRRHKSRAAEAALPDR